MTARTVCSWHSAERRPARRQLARSAALAKGGSGPNGTATAVTIVKELNETISPSAPRKLSAEAIRRHSMYPAA